jgi:hypothetical protein
MVRNRWNVAATMRVAGGSYQLAWPISSRGPGIRGVQSLPAGRLVCAGGLCGPED